MYYNDLLKEIEKEDISNFNYLLKYKFNLNTNDFIPKKDISKLKKLVIKARNIPVQYIVGNVNFYGYLYNVNKNVLIPRFETEELVENTIQIIKKKFNNTISILDLCTGSGCIGITLKREINANVTISDISKKALKVAKINSKGLNIKIIQSDIFKNIKDKYDVIISNPPYIRNNEEIEGLVYDNEPHLALFGGEDGLDLYRKIRKDILNYVNDRYLIAFEIGDLQKEAVVNLFSDLDNVEIITKKDLSNRDRMVFILKK